MSDKPHIVRIVADEARQRYFYRGRNDLPKPRIREQEIGVEFVDGEFIPYADLGYCRDTGFFRLSAAEDQVNEATPFAASGRLIDLGQIVVTTGVSWRLTAEEIRDLLERHGAGDYGDNGEFYELDIDDDMLSDDPRRLPDVAFANKVNTLTGMDCIVSSYAVREHRVWVITEAGERRTTLMLFAGPVRA